MQAPVPDANSEEYEELGDIFSQLRDAQWAMSRDANEDDEGGNDVEGANCEETFEAFGVYSDVQNTGDDEDVKIVEGHNDGSDIEIVSDEDGRVAQPGLESANTGERPHIGARSVTSVLMAAGRSQVFLAASRPAVKIPLKRSRVPFPRARGPCPFFHRVPGTSFIVDGFPWAGEGCKNYFLTHFHADHYGGLKRSFNHGAIFCSKVTARLLELRIGVALAPRGPVHALPFDTPCSIPGTGGARITLLDANHCPGAAMMLFEIPVVPISAESSANQVSEHQPQPKYRTYLHTGDMRWQMRLGEHAALAAYCTGQVVPRGMASPWDAAVSRGSRLEGVYLDTTYASPGRTFPSQDAAVAAAVHVAVKAALSDPGLLLLFGTYSIGKERLFLAVARALGERVYAPAAKLATLARALPSHDAALLTGDPNSARIHVVPMVALSLTRLTAQLRALQAHAAALQLHAAQADTKARGATREQQQLQLVNRAIRAEASAAAAVLAIGGKRKLPALAAVSTSRLPASASKRTRGRGGAFAALMAQSRAASVLQANSVAENHSSTNHSVPRPISWGASQPLSQTQILKAPPDIEDENEVDGVENRQLEKKARARTFHSILAFRPTGWVHDAGPQSSVTDPLAGASSHCTNAGVLDSPERVTISAWNRGEEEEEGDFDTRCGDNTNEQRSIHSRQDGKGPWVPQVCPSVAATVHVSIHRHDPLTDKAVKEVRAQSSLDLIVNAGHGPERVRTTYQARGSAAISGAIMAAVTVSSSASASYGQAAPVGAGCVLLFGIPYSEHSSFNELRSAVKTLTGLSGPHLVLGDGGVKVIPTVGCKSSEAARKTVRLLAM